MSECAEASTRLVFWLAKKIEVTFYVDHAFNLLWFPIFSVFIIKRKFRCYVKEVLC